VIEVTIGVNAFQGAIEDRILPQTFYWFLLSKLVTRFSWLKPIIGFSLLKNILLKLVLLPLDWIILGLIFFG
jgi:hypothetical protein